MAIVVLTFVVILTIILGAYYAFVVRLESDDRLKLLRRLGKPKATSALFKPGELERPVDKLSNVRAVQSLLLRANGLSHPLERLITQSGLTITVGTLVLASVLLGCVGYLVVKIATHLTFLALAGAVVFASIPVMFVRWKRTRRFRAFEEQFPEAIGLMARALRAGHAFHTGILMVADEIPNPVGAEFKLLYDRQNFGMSLNEALKGMAERVPILDARFFATAVLTQRETGGNLSEILDNLADVIRDRFKVKRQVRAVTAHGRMTGWILSAIPPVLALMLALMSPDFMKPMITDPLGTKMIAAGCTMQVIGTLIIRKLVNIRY
ncbi:MAG TPA: type II secretion system F family protein [Vicinamibacterales bacterium]|nr:type II secretion system F family protein [Vicinamibacterales bacterium]